MPRGSQPGERRGGRQKGTPNKSTVLKKAALSAACADTPTTPLEFLLSVMRDPAAPTGLRVQVARAAAPLVLGKSKIASVEDGAGYASAALDCASTRQAAPFLPCCSDIVAIGRVKWIQGSKHTGKDNHAWCRFDAWHRGGPVFHGRDQSEMIPSRRISVCEQCRKTYKSQRSSSRFCSEVCRQRAHRNRLSVTFALGFLGSVPLCPAC